MGQEWAWALCKSELSLQEKVDVADVPRTTVTITKLKAFLDFYLGCNKEKSPSTTVAVIDNGVDGTLSTLSERIIDGQSLVEDFDGHESPWWLASHPHGTQMASFIHQLDPCCGLYIVKVCDGSGGIDADILAEVCLWHPQRYRCAGLIEIGNKESSREES